MILSHFFSDFTLEMATAISQSPNLFHMFHLMKVKVVIYQKKTLYIYKMDWHKGIHVLYSK